MSFLKRLFGKSDNPGVEPAEQCAKCRQAVGMKGSQQAVLDQYGMNPDELLLIATGQIPSPEVINAGGLVCQNCHKKYCPPCAERMKLTCCGARMWIGTHYLTK